MKCFLVVSLRSFFWKKGFKGKRTKCAYFVWEND